MSSRKLNAGLFFEIQMDIEEGVSNQEVADQLSSIFDSVRDVQLKGIKLVDVQGELGLENPNHEEEEKNPLLRNDIMEV